MVSDEIGLVRFRLGATCFSVSFRLHFEYSKFTMIVDD